MCRLSFQAQMSDALSTQPKEVLSMLSVKHFVCCGMDVHKKFVVATIAITDYRGVTSSIQKKVRHLQLRSQNS